MPKLFVLYVPNCTVSKLHFGEPIFPLESFFFFCLDHRRDFWEEKNKKCEGNQRQHTERMSSLFNENNQYPHYLFKVMHLLGNVVFFMLKKQMFYLSWFSVLFSWQKGYLVAFTKKKCCLICQWRLQWNHRYAFYFNCVQVWIYYK